LNPMLGRVADDHGAEPAFGGISLTHEEGRSLRVAWAGTELFRYVYGPWEPQIESPRPYLHPVRTLRGHLVSTYRPHDHVWHKGISWALCNVGPDNFWGGPTYLTGEGYRQLANNGTMRHEALGPLDLGPQGVSFTERLRWITQPGHPCIAERRRVAVRIHPAAGTWQLAFETCMTNISGGTLAFGSPTTRGRPDAGYGGLMWRGPRSFADGKVLFPGGSGGDELMGTRSPWMAFAGRHDGYGTASTLVLCDSPRNFCAPTQWFARATPFAAICPAPFFAAERPLGPGESLTLRYDVFVADGVLDVPGCEALADLARHTELLAPSPGAGRGGRETVPSPAGMPATRREARD